jgi:MFS family permease
MTTRSLDPLAPPTKLVSSQWTALLSIANLALWMGYFGPLQVLLPNQAESIDPANKELILGIVTGVGALIAMVGNPLFGALSDRTTLRQGRRHPWILAGALVGAAGLAFLAVQNSVMTVVLGWAIAQIGLNALQAAATAQIPDQVPIQQRASVAGWVTSQQLVGLVMGVVVAGMLFATQTSGYLALAVIIPVLVVPFVMLTKDRVLPVEHKPEWNAREFLRGFWISPQEHPDFAWAWLTRFLMQVGYSLATLYLLFYLRDELGFEQLFPGRKAEDGLLLLILINTVVAAIATVLGGYLSDRLGKRRIFVTVAGMVMGVPGILMALWPSWPLAITAALILGLGYGVYMSVDQALITQVLPSAASQGRDLGVINIANSLPQVLAPAIAAPLVAFSGYPALYLTMAVIAFVGAVLVRNIKSVP